MPVPEPAAPLPRSSPTASASTSSAPKVPSPTEVYVWPTAPPVPPSSTESVSTSPAVPSVLREPEAESVQHSDAPLVTLRTEATATEPHVPLALVSETVSALFQDATRVSS